MSYKYYNRNPEHKEKEDCVCRAISTATGLKYYAVNRLLEMTAYNYSCDMLCKSCYHNLLDGVLGYKCIKCKNTTVGELSDEYFDKKIIIRINSHLTCSIYGVVLDIWDCSDEKVDCFWIIE